MDNMAFKPNEALEVPREAPPPYSPISALIGLELLSTLSRVDVRRDITTENGDMIFKLKRELIQKGCSASFCFDLYDATGRMVIRMTPVNSFCNGHLQVLVNGQYAAKLGMNSFFACTQKYAVFDATGAKVLKINTPGFGQNMNRFLLRLKDLQGNQIGSITKKWNGLADEIFADSNELQIDFPKELGVQYKAAVIAFCIFIIQEANVQYQYRR